MWKQSSDRCCCLPWAQNTAITAVGLVGLRASSARRLGNVVGLYGAVSDLISIDLANAILSLRSR